MTCLVNTPVPLLKVLFVEDDAIDRLAFKRVVRQSALPYDYVIATSLAEATTILEEQTFDIAILDFHLGDGTALELIEQIKNKKLPFIVATGSGDEEIAVQMMQQGAYDYLIKDPNRHYLKVLSTVIDKAITQKRHEEKIRLLTHAMQNVHDGIYITDRTNRLLFINEALSQICQCSPDAVIGKPIQVLNQSDLTQLLTSAKSSQTELEILNAEVKLTPSDGSSFTALLSESPLREVENSQTRIGLLRDISKLKQVEQDLQVARDSLEQQVQQRTAQLQQANLSLQAEITERKRVEARLRESEQRYATLAAAVPVGIFRTDVMGNCIYVNNHYCQISGLSSEAALGDGWQRRLHPNDRQRVVQEWIQSVQENRSFQIECRFQTQDGSVTWVYAQAVAERDANQQIIGYVGTITDISDRKQAEQALQNLIAGTATTTGQDFFPALASYIAEALGVSYVIVTEQLDKTLHTLAFWANGRLQSPFSYDIIHTPCEQVLERGSLYCEHSVQQMFPDDLDLVDLEAESYLGIACHDIQGRTIGHLCIMGKQTIQDSQRAEQILRVFAARAGAELERQRATTSLEQLNSSLEAKVEARTAELQEQKQFLQTVLDTFPLSVFWKDRNSVYMGCNRNFLQDAGLSSVAEVINKTDYDLPWRKTEAEAYQADDRNVINSNTAKIGIIETQVQADGKQTWLETNKLPLHNLTGEVIGVLGTYQDISDRKLAEINLRQSQEFLQTVLDVLPLYVFWKDRQSVYLGCNQNFANAAGLTSPKEIVGKTDYDLPWADTEAEVYRTDDKEVMTSNTHKLGIIETQVQADGNQVWIETSKVPLHSVEDEVIGVLGMFQDITSRKRAEIALQAKTEELDRFFSLALDLLCIANTDGYFLRLNSQWEKTLGYSREELTQITFFDYIHPDDLDQTLKAIAQLREGEELPNFVNRYRCQDGSYCWLEWRATPQGHLIYAAARDITERKQAEAQLKQTNEELARATRLKDEFLANMSHELRTPLNAILGMTEVLQEEVLGDLNSQQRKALETVERSGCHLLELINDILDVAKIESGQIELDCTSVSIHHLCQSSLSFIKQQALKKRIQLEIKLPVNLPEVVVDERRIRQVLINLLNNAVKFTPEGGRITLEVTFPVQNTQESTVKNPLQIDVIDTGIGIPSEKITKLFQPFVQIDSALNRQYTGTGLGLALVKRIVELHGGEVKLTSQEGVGSCFSILLPSIASFSSSAELQTSSRLNTRIYSAQPQDSPLILLAEDNEANIRTISSYLRAKRYRLVVARNGEEAIIQAQLETPDLIVMDIQMPKMDGLEAIKRIRQDPNLVHIPIVALTALAMSGDREQCLEAGASDYLSKPIQLKQLVNSIQRLLTLKSS